MKKLQILGTGCPKCRKLAELVKQSAKELGIEYEIEKITKINDIMKFGVMLMPALVVDGQVKIAGRIPTTEQLKELLK